MATKKCIECGEQFSDTLQACPNCGCPAEATMLCPECGTSFDAETDCCPECGCPTSVMHEIATSEVVEPAPQPVAIIPEPEPVVAEAQPVVSTPEQQVQAQEDDIESELDSVIQKGKYVCEECGTFFDASLAECPECGCPAATERVVCPECFVAYDSKLLECPNCGCINETIDKAVIQKIVEEENAELQELEAEKRVLEENLLLNLQHAAKGADVSNSVIMTLARSFLRFDNFSGRARRSEFWIFVSFNTIISFVLCAVLLACMGRDYITISLARTETEYLYRLFTSCLTDHLIITSVIILYLLLVILPFISLTVRRLHDTNRSGLWILLGIIPFILGCIFNFSPFWGIAILALMLLLDSVGDNKWGQAPHRA